MPGTRAGVGVGGTEVGVGVGGTGVDVGVGPAASKLQAKDGASSKHTIKKRNTFRSVMVKCLVFILCALL